MVRVFIGYFILALLLVPLAYHAVFACRGVRTFDLVSLEDFKTYYRSNGYSLESLLNGDLKEVPRVFLNRIPKVWSEDSLSTENRKNIFFLFTLPIILKVNEDVLAERDQVLDARRVFLADKPLTRSQVERLVALARRYGVLSKEARTNVDFDPSRPVIGLRKFWILKQKNDNSLVAGEKLTLRDIIKELLLRVDAIPVSLALGQAAYESAYGTSRFAYLGNALFGQWSWGQRGIFPKKRRDGLGDYRIATFRTPIDSARSYANNLNTFFAYEAFRKLRAKQRSLEAGFLDGYEMAATLESYSELRQVYVKTLRKIIRENRLERLSEIRLCECCTGRPARMTMGWFLSDRVFRVQNINNQIHSEGS